MEINKLFNYQIGTSIPTVKCIKGKMSVVFPSYDQNSPNSTYNFSNLV